MTNSQPKVNDKQYKLKTKYILELFFNKKQRFSPFRNKKNHKIAFSYVIRGIIWKIYMQELWFLCMTHCLNVLLQMYEVSL